jgi:MerR family redox-sensitive transcriptional activator SoxR
MKIGAIAERTQTPASTIRYYERIGILPRAQRKNGQRMYDKDIIEYLEAIASAQSLGFSLDEIRTLLGTFQNGDNPSDECRAMAKAKIEELDVMISKAQRMKQILEHGLTCQCTSLSGCYLNESS